MTAPKRRRHCFFEDGEQFAEQLRVRRRRRPRIGRVMLPAPAVGAAALVEPAIDVSTDHRLATVDADTPRTAGALRVLRSRGVLRLGANLTTEAPELLRGAVFSWSFHESIGALRNDISSPTRA